MCIHAQSVNMFTTQIENGLMTPTMKVRREVVYERYKDEIDGLFNANKDI